MTLAAVLFAALWLVTLACWQADRRRWARKLGRARERHEAFKRAVYAAHGDVVRKRRAAPADRTPTPGDWRAFEGHDGDDSEGGTP